MRVTKSDWAEILIEISQKLDKPLKELKGSKFYRGTGIWNTLDGNERSELMDILIGWFQDRKHKIAFSAIEKSKADEIDWDDFPGSCHVKGTPNYWRLAALHLMLSLQKHLQNEKNNKGHTVMVFDQELTEKGDFPLLALDPPQWTDSFYGYRRQIRKKNPCPPLECIIDVPYFADSQQVGLIQVADLFSYLLRHHAELQCEYVDEQYKNESEKIEGWVSQIAQFVYPDATRWPEKGACECASLFREIAPEPLLGLHKEYKE